MDAVDYFALASWPLAAAGISILVWASRQPDGRTRETAPLIWGAATILMFGPVIPLMTYFHAHSAIVLAQVDGFLIAWGLLILASPWWSSLASLWWRPMAFRTRRWLMSAVGLGLLGLGAWLFTGDFISPRKHTAGLVMAKRLEDKSRRWVRHDYVVYLNGVAHKTTAQVFDAVQVGRRYQVQIGNASERVLEVGPL